MAFVGLAKGPPVAAGPSSSSHAGWSQDSRPTTVPVSIDDAKGAFARVEDSRQKLLELEQLVVRAQGSVRAVRAREEAVRRDCGEQERRLRHLDREHAAAREDFQAEHLEPLQRAEAKASERLRQEQAAEKEARRAVERMRGRILDLSGDFGSALLGSAADGGGGSEPSKAHKLLRAALPAAHPAWHASDLDDLLGMLEAERAEVQAMLLGLPAADRGGRDALEALREEAAGLRKEAARAEAQAQRGQRRAEDLRSEASAAAADARGDAEDALLEAATLRREVGLWRRQQAEWERSQGRMLQLTGDLQHERDRGLQRQALVAKRLRELKRELPLEGGGERVLEGIRGENSALQRQIEGLQRERAELLRKKQGLVSFVNSRLSEIQATVDGAETPNGEPCGRDCYPPSP